MSELIYKITIEPLKEKVEAFKMSIIERIQGKSALRFPIYRGQKKNPETGKCDCPWMISKKEWQRLKWGRQLLERYNRRYVNKQMVEDLMIFHRGMPKD